MTLAPIYADVEGAVVAWAAADATLTGRGQPLAGGLHLGEIRSPAEGAVGFVEVTSRAVDGGVDTARVGVTVLARRRGPAEIAARAVADRLPGVAAAALTVTTARGERVRLWAAGDVTGPGFVGDFGGEVAYRVDFTLAAQPV